MPTPQLILLCVLFSSGLTAQYKLKKNTRLFDDTHVHRIDILIDTAHISELLHNPDSSIMHPANFIIQHASESDTINNIGFRIKGQTSRYNPKKSFKLSFNEYQKGQKYDGVEKLNLNTFWNDPTHIRSHLASEVYYFVGIPVSRSSFTDLYINGEYYGLYNIVEHIDDEFTKSRYGSKKGNLYKCLSGANLVYLGENQNFYASADSMFLYALKSNKKKNDYSGLIELTDILTNTPINDLPAKLEARFNVEDYLKIMAVDIAVANWDNYIFVGNNYYLYDNPETGKFEFMPYDFDNTFGIDWTGNDWGKTDIYNWAYRDHFFLHPDSLTDIKEDEREWIRGWYNHFLQDTIKPLYTRILDVDEYRNQFNIHLRNIIDNYLGTEDPLREIDRVFAILTPSLEQDTNDNFTWEQVQASIDEALDVHIQFWSYEHKYLPYGLKEFIEVSNKNILSQIEAIKPNTIVNNGRIKK